MLTRRPPSQPTADRALTEILRVRLTLPQRIANARFREPLHALHLERHQARNQALRGAMTLLPANLSSTHAAEALSRIWSRYVEEDWLQDRAAGETPTGSDSLRIVLFGLAELTEGQVLGWKRIHEVCSVRV